MKHRGHQGRTKMSQNRRCRRPSRTPVTSSHQNPILKIELCQNRRRHRSSRLPRVDVTSSHQNLILKIELCQNRRRHRSSRLPRVDVTSSHQNLILKIELCQNRHFLTTHVLVSHVTVFSVFFGKSKVELCDPQCEF